MPLASHGLANPGASDILQHAADKGGHAKMACRADTMFMDRVRPADVPLGRRLANKDVSPSLCADDIEGAFREPRRLFLSGPAQKEPIPGTAAKTRYPEVHRPLDLSLTTRDIYKAQPSGPEFSTTRNLDPLTPAYELPSCKMIPVTPPHGLMHEGAVRDSMEFKGMHKSRFLERDYARDPNECRDIDLGFRRRQNMTPRDFSSKVVERAGERVLSTKCHSARSSNPLSPVYDAPSASLHPLYRGEEPSKLAPKTVGLIEGSTPRQLHRDNGEPQNSLIRRDIPGAVSMRFKGRVPFNIYDKPEVTPISRHLGLDCSDIEGTQPGTRKAGTWAAFGTR